MREGANRWLKSQNTSAAGRNLGQVYIQKIAGGICVHSSPYPTVDPKFSALDSKVYQWKISVGFSHLRLLH
jgi:hypothetical protein